MLKVFLVEDETVIREGLRDRIPWEQYGYRFVGEAADGEVALPLIRKTRPDVLITDIKMPFMDGLSLSRIVREEFPKTKILIISGYDDFEYAREAISIGVDQYILKPVTRMSLRKVLQELKEKIEAEQEQEDFQSKLANEMHEYGISSTLTARFSAWHCSVTSLAMDRICSWVRLLLRLTVSLALVTAVMILVISNGTSEPLRLMIFIVFLRRSICVQFKRVPLAKEAPAKQSWDAFD